MSGSQEFADLKVTDFWAGRAQAPAGTYGMSGRDVIGWERAELTPTQMQEILAAQKARIADAVGDGVVPTTITRQMRRHPERFVQKRQFIAAPRSSSRRSGRGMGLTSAALLAATLSGALMSNARR